MSSVYPLSFGELDCHSDHPGYGGRESMLILFSKSDTANAFIKLYYKVLDDNGGSPEEDYGALLGTGDFKKNGFLISIPCGDYEKNTVFWGAVFDEVELMYGGFPKWATGWNGGGPDNYPSRGLDCYPSDGPDSTVPDNA